MDWEAWRDEFPTLSRKTYLNTCSLGPLSRRSRAAVGRFLDLWEDLGASAWYELWLGEAEALRRKVARVIGGQPSEIALLSNVSSALSVFASSLDYGARPEVVTSDLDFPTVPYQFLAKPGVRTRFAQSADGITMPAAAFEPHVGPQTAAIATTHVVFTTGAIVDVPAVARLARKAGARMFLDAYHGTGQLPTDVRALGVDAYASGGLKWLMGGPGIAFLWVRREIHGELSPAITSWFAHKDQFRFDPRAFEPHPEAKRFELGTHSVGAIYALSASLDIVDEIGPERIRARTMDLVRDLLERLEDAKLRALVPRDPAQRSGIVAVAHDDPARAVAHLASKGIIVDKRPGRVRVSPYFYNTYEENEKLVSALRETA